MLLFSKPRVLLSVVFFQLRQTHWLGQFFGLPSIPERFLPRRLQIRLNSSAGEVVEFHQLMVPVGWNWPVWLVQHMLEYLLPDECVSQDLSVVMFE